MMMRPLSIRVTLAACACVLLAAAPALGQEITPEEVTAVLEAPAVKGALDACGKSHPHLAASIEFVFIVGTGGQVTLNETKPAVSPELFLCFQTAAKNIQFKKMQSAFEITYPLEVAAYAPVTPTPLPPVVTATPQPLPAPAGGCTKDTDCKGVRVCVSGQCVDRSPATWTPAAAAAPQVRVSSGVALFIPGMAVDFVGLMLFLGGIASANIGSKNNTADDNSSLLPIHTAGSVLSMTGSILLAGAATMPFASSRKLGGKPSAGPMAVAWVFALMSIAVNGALIGISRDDDHRDYKTYMIPGLAVNFAFVIIQSALWSVSRSKAVSAAKEAAARKQAGLVVLPWVAPSQGGATAGLVMVY